MIGSLTIEREYGSGAAEIAAKLAERLGWKLWDQLLTDEIARRMACDPVEIEKHGERIDPYITVSSNLSCVVASRGT